ncbi:hypothetical protein EBR03_00190 [bacterium]|nr:hypothetical protein [bacterium]
MGAHPMIIKVGILGATGRMGQELTHLLAPGFECGKDLLELSDAVASSEHSITHIEGIPVRSIQGPPREPVHVWIDFSRPEATLSFLENSSGPIVIGTTGFTASQMDKISQFSKKHPVFYASNTSPGMNLMQLMLEKAAPAARLNYEVLASEIHHRGKKDSPSGTMKTLLSLLTEQGHRNIQVQCARVADEKGTHTISFFSDDEELTISHRVNHRRVFAKGALLAAHFIAQVKEPGLYNFKDVEQL